MLTMSHRHHVLYKQGDDQERYPTCYVLLTVPYPSPYFTALRNHQTTVTFDSKGLLQLYCMSHAYVRTLNVNVNMRSTSACIVSDMLM